MKPILQILLPFVLFLGIVDKASCQLPWGSSAPDWTLTDLDGNTWTLSAILNEDKVVYIDFSATWCFPCWNYHNNHVLEDFYQQYGPDGTNEAMVFFIEPDPSTSTSCLYGNCGSTQGDWTNGISYPIISATTTQCNQLINGYNINYFPTIYMISETMQAYEVGTLSAAGLASYLPSGQMSADFAVTGFQCGSSFDIDLTVNAGSGAFDYSWSNGAITEDLTGVGPGNYSVTITDGNDVYIEESITVDSESDIELLGADVESPTCAGGSNGSIFLNVVDETGLTFDWSDGSSGSEIYNLPADTYTVTITDASGCTLVETFIVEDPQGIFLNTIDTAPENCGNMDGSIHVSATGGTGSLTYDIGSGPSDSGYFEHLAAGDYTITIEDDNGCSTLEFITVESAALTDLSIAGLETLSCVVDEVILSGSGSNPDYNYGWKDADGIIISTNTIVTVNTPGFYTFYGALEDCYVEETIEVLESTTVPVAEATVEGMLTCDEVNIPINATTSAVPSGSTILWTTANGNIVSGASTLYPIVNEPGTYTLNITLGNCTSTIAIMVEQDATAPVVALQQDGPITCNQSTVSISSMGTSTGENFEYAWQDDAGNVLGDGASLEVHNSGSYTLIVTNDENGCVAEQSITITTDMELPDVNAGSDAVITCEQLNVMLTGSSDTTADLNYSWTTTDGAIEGEATGASIIVTSGGTYILEIMNQDNGCVAGDTVTVIEDLNPAMAAFNFTSNYLEVSFSNASTGSNVGYSWSFGDGETSTETEPTHVYDSAGTYEVCLSANNGCGTDAFCHMLTVQEATINVSSTITHVTCAGGSDGRIALTIGGTDTVEQYEWSTGATTKDIDNLTAGTYTVTMTTAAGHAYIYTYTVREPEEIVTMVNITDVDCYGASTGSISLQTSGGTGNLSYSWNNGASTSELNGLAAGSYTVVITDENGCTTEEVFNIEQSEELIISIAKVDNEQGSIDVEVEGGTPPYTYLWSDGSTDQDLTDAESGVYTVVVTDALGCMSTIEEVEIMLVNVEEISGLKEILAYPNPFNKEINVTLDLDKRLNGEILIINQEGKIVLKRKLETAKIREKWELSNLPAGYYIISVVTDQGTTSRKIIKN